MTQRALVAVGIGASALLAGSSASAGTGVCLASPDVFPADRFEIEWIACDGVEGDDCGLSVRNVGLEAGKRAPGAGALNVDGAAMHASWSWHFAPALFGTAGTVEYACTVGASTLTGSLMVQRTPGFGGSTPETFVGTCVIRLCSSLGLAPQGGSVASATRP